MFKKIILTFVICSSIVYAQPRLRPPTWAQPLLETGLSNVYQVDKDIYRSEQPDHDNVQELAKLGIHEILNLREYHSDKEAVANSNVVSHSVEMDAATVTQEQVIAALLAIKNKKSPLLVHCWHGSDRTGTVIAAYRMVFQNWTKTQAIDEMVNGGYGYHGSVYPNLISLLESLDIAKIKTALDLQK
jgi:protein tyrosine/serine phosphatase